MTEEIGTNGRAFGASLSEAQIRAAGAANQLAELARGNAEALMESGRLLHGGLRRMGEDAFTEGREALAQMGEDMREMAAVTSPAEAFQFQVRLMQRSASDAMERLLRGPQALFDVTAQGLTPIGGRVKANLEAIRALG